MPQSNVLQELTDRGLIDQVTNAAGVSAYMRQPGASMYVGYDPTASSLHVGHLLPIMVAAHLQRAGVRPIMLVGGATGVVGDPSGRSAERNLLTADVVRENAKAIGLQLQKFVDFEGANAAQLVNNYDWIAPIGVLDWLRDVGKHFTINAMLGKESVRRRLEDRDTGLSYTEFSYMLLQAYDFLHVFSAFDCRMQGGGSDQWGNITAGLDLIRRVRSEEAFGITFPLVTTASGDKFGKSAGNAVWLDGSLTSPFQFYQFWLRSDDSDVIKYLRYFTFASMREIAEIEAMHLKQPENRHAQRRLARDVTAMVHGAALAQQMERVSELAYQKDGFKALEESDWELMSRELPSARIDQARFDRGIPIIDLCVETEFAASKSAVRRLAVQGGLSLNDNRVRDVEFTVKESDLVFGRFLLLKRGGQHMTVVYTR